MKVVYTVGFDRKEKIEELPDAVFQLWYSIYSIRKEWGDRFWIYVYTNQEVFIKYFLSEFEKIKVIKPEEELIKGLAKGWEFTHLRITLLPYLLRTEFDDILYLDPDTGIIKNTGESGLHNLLKLRDIALYSPEPWNYFNLFFTPYQRSIFDLLEDIHLKLEIPRYVTEINNGVVWAPYSKENIEKLEKAIEVYRIIKEELKKIEWWDEYKDSNMLYFFLDQMSLSVIKIRYNLPLLYDEPPYLFNIEKINKGYNIVHYYLGKKNLSPWQCVREILIKRFSYIYPLMWEEKKAVINSG